jgi:ankyrin repeat protein
MHHAIEKGHLDVIKVLIEFSVDFDVADNAGKTPLFEAVDSDQEGMALILLKMGARVNCTNYYGHTPLYYAARDGNLDLVKLIVEEGKADVDFHGRNNVMADLDES